MPLCTPECTKSCRRCLFTVSRLQGFSHVQAGDDDAAAAEEELGLHAVSDGYEDGYISVPDGEPMQADLQTIKGLSYTQAFGIYKVTALVLPAHIIGQALLAEYLVLVYCWLLSFSGLMLCLPSTELRYCAATVSGRAGVQRKLCSVAAAEDWKSCA